MNTVYALMVVTAMGVTEAPNPFLTLSACEKVSAKIEKSYCVEKKPVDIETEMNKLISLMKKLQEN